MYIAEAGAGTVSEILASGGPEETLATGLGFPLGLAVDSSGNLYMADYGDGTVKEALASNGNVNTLASGYAGPQGVAVDSSGNVYFADAGDNSVYEILAVNGGIPPSPTINLVGGGFSEPENLALDSKGNIYIADVGNSAIKEMTPACSPSSYGTCVTTLASGFSIPEGVTLDGNRNVYFSTVGDNSLREILAVNGTIPASPTILSLGSGFLHPIGLANDVKGDVFVANYGSGTVSVVRISGVNLGAVNIGSATPLTASIPFTFTATENLGAPVVLTQGVTNRDFTQTATTCSGTISAGSSCTVAIQFAPAAPGLRLGGVQLEDSSGNLLATANIYGIGTGPQVSFPSNSSPSNVGNGFASPSGVAIDGSGDVFIVDSGNNAVKEIVAVAGKVSSSSTVNTVGSGFKDPDGVAVDGSGNVFVADNGNNAVKEIVAVNGQVTSASIVNTVGSGFSAPGGVAVDGSGDVFVSDSGNNAVKEILACNGQVSSASTVIVVGSGFTTPKGVAVDATGDVFVADNGKNAVKEIVAVNGQVSSSSTVNNVGSGFSGPNGVAVDAAGDIFVADQNNSMVKEIVAVNGKVSSASTVVPMGWGFTSPAGVAVDASGSVFVADEAYSAALEMPLATAPSLDFSATERGTTDTADGPLAATITNNGNATLTFNLPTTGDNPSLSTSNFTWDDTASTCTQTTQDSSTAFTLAEGASCTLAVDFTPTSSGALTDNLSVTDNTLNAVSATQQIPLSGFAAVSATMITPSPSSTLNSGPTTFTWNAGSGGVTAYYLWIGTTPGGSDLANVSPSPLTGTSVTVNLPANGSTIYVELWTEFSGGAFLSNSYTYSEANVSAAAITSPGPGSTLTSASTTFTWSAATGNVTYYVLYVGSTPGSYDLADVSPSPLTGTSATVNLPTNGATIYVRLWTIINGSTYFYNDYTYTEATIHGAAITSPGPGSTLTSAINHLHLERSHG